MFKPSGEYILVEPMEAADEATESGLLIPGSTQVARLPQGKVIAVGADIYDYQPGNIIVYKGWNTLRIGVKQFHLVNYKEAFGAFVEESPVNAL